MFLDKLGFCAACPEMERMRNPKQPVFWGRSVFVQELLLKGGLPSKFKNYSRTKSTLWASVAFSKSAGEITICCPRTPALM